MIISHKILAQHLTPAQYGAFVAHCLKDTRIAHVHVDRVLKTFTLGFHIADLQDISELSAHALQLQKEIAALAEIDPMPCPCGCSAFLAISPCLAQSGDVGGLSVVEHDLAKGGNKIGAIKEVRMRLGCGLKDAKDLVDKFYPPTYR